MQVRALRRSPKALVATMLATVMIFGTTIAAMAGVSNTPPVLSPDLEAPNLIKADATYAQGTTTNLEVRPKVLAEVATGDYHLEWYSDAASTVAKVNRTSGLLDVKEDAPVGTVVNVTVYVVDGTTVESGAPGSGTGPWYPLADDVQAYGECTFTVTAGTVDPSEYGFQGTGGLQMKMTNPSDISASGTINNATGIVNTINGNVGLTDGTATFQFQLDGGLNSETAFVTNGNDKEIHVYSYARGNLGEEVGTITYVGTDVATATVTINASGLESGNQYVIEFASAIKGNNNSKTLGTNIYFIFNV